MEIIGRELRLEWIEEAVARPIHVAPNPGDSTSERRYARIAACGNRVLRVVCRERDDTVEVITVFFDRNAGRRL